VFWEKIAFISPSISKGMRRLKMIVSIRYPIAKTWVIKFSADCFDAAVAYPVDFTGVAA
jgi:hypothetical protein